MGLRSTRNLGFVTPFVILLVTGMIGGCTPWPDEGGGGIAERRPSDNSELAELELRLQDVIARGSRQHYAAQTAEAEIQLVRTRRTYSAGFAADYAANYQLLSLQVRDIEAHIPHSSGQRRKKS